ncbi:cytochrome-c peroxidase [Lacibacterium aquatile]|uniref:Cytochrome-c peroxidase n=1 Tax=Lacibacterium aquatile TaxID=1168082 RepID=A0ABW5DTS4_9PROT
MRQPFIASFAISLLTLPVLAQGLPTPQEAERYRLPTTPTTAENIARSKKVELGYELFFDARLSGNESISCASCHLPTKGWSTNGRPKRANDTVMPRASQTVLGMGHTSNEKRGWGANRESAVVLMKAVISEAGPMNVKPPELVAKLNDVPAYKALFHTVYGRDGDMDAVIDALDIFMKSIEYPKTRFDHWIAGNPLALTDAEVKGFRTFTGETANCTTCHGGPRFTQDAMHDIGLKVDAAKPDKGLGDVTKKAEDDFAFKTPTLRSAAQRAPYGHDGQVASLDALVEHYMKGGEARPTLSFEIQRFSLTAEEKSNLVAFLQSLDPATQEFLPPLKIAKVAAERP